ncbi:hypothetical protein ACLOJK_019246 [Asimina triloba]
MEEHYACLIDILGRAGRLDEAVELVNGLPFGANPSVWGALLGASRIHENFELGMWDNVAQVRRLMKDSKVKKEHGVKDKVHAFTVGDRNHYMTKEIYAKLGEFRDLMTKAGYVPMVETDLHDVEQSEKEALLYHHCGKLAVAFGLIIPPPGSPTRVKRNLQVRMDCHSAFKFICKIASGEIIIGDINRFRHFRDE